MLDKMEILEKPTEVRSEMHITLEPKITSGNDVLTVEHLSKAFGPLQLFSDLNFSIKRGERVALIGNNGTGKTTILKILNGLLDADSGSFTLGARVQIGYYDQEPCTPSGKDPFRRNFRRLPGSGQYHHPQHTGCFSVYRR